VEQQLADARDVDQAGTPIELPLDRCRRTSRWQYRIHASNAALRTSNHPAIHICRCRPCGNSVV
jgi:hypothetical protein